MNKDWKDIKVFFGGVEIKCTSFHIKYIENIEKQIEDLQKKLKVAEMVEDYELCAKLKAKIDKFG